MAISASYYGAKDALSSSLGDAPVAARDAGSAFWELAFHAHEDMDADTIKAKAKMFANAVVQYEVLRTVLLPDAQIYFRRDWPAERRARWLARAVPYYLERGLLLGASPYNTPDNLGRRNHGTVIATHHNAVVG